MAAPPADSEDENEANSAAAWRDSVVGEEKKGGDEGALDLGGAAVRSGDGEIRRGHQRGWR